VTGVSIQEGFFQILKPNGEIVSTTLRPESQRVLPPVQVQRASRTRAEFQDKVPGIEGEARVVAEPAQDPQGRKFIIVVGTSTDDRREALAGLTRDFLIAAPIALVLASALGYLLAGRALAPVRAMTKRAGRISLERTGDRLPLPNTEDEIHELGTTLNTMLDRLEAGIRREREFVADASHELRTPLAILKGELELADRPGRGLEELRETVSSTREEVDRLSHLAADLLVIARADQEGLPLSRQRAELRPLLERIRERFQSRAERSGRTIQVEAAEGIEASVDPLRIEQAVGNLVDNALRYGEGAIEISARQEDGSLIVEVSDHGKGFPPGFAARAFERFSRGDPARSGSGAGLGLAIVEAIAHAHGGRAEIAADGGGRPAVRLSIPA
jgi:heavy metal sensor kinase